MMKSKQFYWKIEALWEQYYGKLGVNNVKNFNFTPSKNPVFFDDNENNKPYFGLENDSQIIERNGKKIFLTDNHHKVLEFLFDTFLESKQKITLIHIDAHRDDAIFQHYEKCSFEIEEVKNYIKSCIKNYKKTRDRDEETVKIKNYINIIQNNCRISDYLDVALYLGIVEEVISITQTSEFENIAFQNFSDKNVILNLDIDIYGPEGEVVSTDLKTEVIAKSWKIANAVCIATSPAFIHEDMAEKIIEILTVKV